MLIAALLFLRFGLGSAGEVAGTLSLPLLAFLPVVVAVALTTEFNGGERVAGLLTVDCGGWSLAMVVDCPCVEARMKDPGSPTSGFSSMYSLPIRMVTRSESSNDCTPRAVSRFTVTAALVFAFSTCPGPSGIGVAAWLVRES